MEKLVPKLRFPEFEGNWEKKRLEEVSTFLDGKRKPIKSQERQKMKGIYPYYGASGIIDYVNDYIFDEELILLGEDGENIVSRNLPLAFRVSGKCWVNNHAHVIIPNKDTNIDFLTHNLERLDYAVYNTGSAQPKLNQEVCKKIITKFPSLPEQQKIATFLTSVDERLTLLAQQKEKLELYKKGVMQQIFSQKLRFKDENGNECPDWEEKKLGDLVDVVKGKQLNKEELSEVGTYPCQNGGIEPSGYTEEFNTIENTITISEGGNSCGYVNFMTSKFWCGGHCYSLLNIKNNVMKQFLFQYLKFNQNEIMKLRVGSGLPNIQKGSIANFRIEIPCLEEQQKIASFLSAIDVQIEGVSKKIEQTKMFKKGLLQQMYV